MSSAEERSPLVEEVLSGNRRELQLLAAEGLLPLPLPELIELQVKLTGSSDEAVAEMARRSLADLEPRSVVSIIREGATPEVLTFMALNRAHPTILEAVLQDRRAGPELLVELAPRLPGEMQEVLLLRQDAIVESPAILDALEANPELTAYARRRVDEYREHLLPRREPAKTAAAALEEEAEALTEEEVRGAIEEAGKQPTKGQVEEFTGLTESQIRSLPAPVRLKLSRGAPRMLRQIRSLPAPVRLKLSRGAPRMLRQILVRDPSPQVATSVVQNNPLTDGEVEEIAANRSVRSEVLQTVSANRSWMRRYSIVLALVRNPRSPAGMAIRLVSRLAIRDLLSVSRDHNVPHAVRAMALRLYRMKRN